MRVANVRLADHQRIRGVTVWPGDRLPRTEGTQKLKRGEIKAVVEKDLPPPTEPSASDRLGFVLAKYARGRTIAPATTFDELGLSSLERVELLLELEDHLQTRIDEETFSNARDVGALQAMLQSPGVESPRESRHVEAISHERFVFPAWSRQPVVQAVRQLFLAVLILPLTRLFAWIRVEGREHVQSLSDPVILASNHQSHMDVPVILAALPSRYRYRVATAMSKQYFDPHFFPQQHPWSRWLTNSLLYYWVVLLFHAFPFPQRGSGVRETLRYVGDLIFSDFSILIFPEGKRTERGEINPFQPGVGMMASRLDLPVIPVRLDGLDRVLHRNWKMARPGRVRVTFGPPLHLEGEDYAALAQRVEDAVRNLSLKGFVYPSSGKNSY
jgi:long-chain acyl-CoA synthetase